jgi:hypothetical protein
MVEFYLVLAAITVVSGGIFWRLLIGSFVMLVAGYCGEAGYVNPMLGFIIGMAGRPIFCMKSSWVKQVKSPQNRVILKQHPIQWL